MSLRKKSRAHRSSLIPVIPMINDLSCLFSHSPLCSRLFCYSMNALSSFPSQDICIGMGFSTLPEMFFLYSVWLLILQLSAKMSLPRKDHALHCHQMKNLSFSVFYIIDPYFCFIPFIERSIDCVLIFIIFVSFTCQITEDKDSSTNIWPTHVYQFLFIIQALSVSVCGMVISDLQAYAHLIPIANL